MLRVLGRVGPAVVWAGVIFWYSAQADPPRPTALMFEWLLGGVVPRDAYPLVDHLLRKAAHFTEYAVLAVLLHHALGLMPRWGDRARCVVAVLLAALYATSDEFHQSFVPGRTELATDVLIDSCGAVAGVMVRRLLNRWWTRPPPPVEGPSRRPTAASRATADNP